MILLLIVKTNFTLQITCTS